MRSFFNTLMIFALAAATALAGDVSGKWKYEMTTPNGDKREGMITLKAEGDKLTGNVSSPRGETPITDGKVSGDDVEFSVVRNFNGNEFKMQYKGKVVGDEMKLTVGAGERTFEVTAKRSAS